MLVKMLQGWPNLPKFWAVLEDVLDQELASEQV
jgi:hypothetical protein